MTTTSFFRLLLMLAISCVVDVGTISAEGSVAAVAELAPTPPEEAKGGPGDTGDPSGQSASSATVELRSGEVLRVRMIDEDDSSITVEHDILGRLTIQRTDIRTITTTCGSNENSRVGDAMEGDVVADEVIADTGDAGECGNDSMPPGVESGSAVADGTPGGGTSGDAQPTGDAVSGLEDRPSIWKSQVELSLSAREGRTQSTDVRLAFRTGFETDVQTFRYDASYYTRTNRSDRTDQRVTTGAFWERTPRLRRGEHRRDTPWSYFLQGRFDYDEFNAWDYRVTASAGIGYLLFSHMAVDEAGVEYEQVKLRLRSGGGVRREFGSSDDEFHPEGLVSAELAWRPVQRQQVAVTSTYFQTLDESDNFRVVTNAEWEVAIDQMNGVNLKLGLAHEHQSITPSPSGKLDVRKDDLYVYAALVVNF